jgi:hypothetical protein
MATISFVLTVSDTQGRARSRAGVLSEGGGASHMLTSVAVGRLCMCRSPLTAVEHYYMSDTRSMRTQKKKSVDKHGAELMPTVGADMSWRIHFAMELYKLLDHPHCGSVRRGKADVRGGSIIGALVTVPKTHLLTARLFVPVFLLASCFSPSGASQSHQ